MTAARSLVAGVLLGALLAGCGEDEASPDAAAPPSPAAAATPPAPPAGYQGFAVAEAGFALAVPKGWTRADQPAPSKFQAFSPDSSGANVTVLVNPAPGFELADLEREYADALKSGISARKVEVARVRTAGGEGLRATYRAPFQSPGGKTVSVDAVQYVHIADGTQYILTVTLLGSKVTEKTADAIGRSFFLL